MRNAIFDLAVLVFRNLLLLRPLPIREFAEVVFRVLYIIYSQLLESSFAEFGCSVLLQTEFREAGGWRVAEYALSQASTHPQ
jgi:hypothetical protein